ncbi:excinuclease ABC subunit UvrB [Candidatus Gottesmanbacteria bacterium]|nr:excinuclease ABC subunit UvrB [Candidatus Gottesmanbacteria bacterium]
MKFKIQQPFQPTGDQPEAIESLTKGVENGLPYQVLIGVTGSGKTFTMANVIEKLKRPTLVISHNKTLAAQLYQEFKVFFPKNAVGYFVSYYDYYQPEAYIPQTDTYIEKETEINEEIDKLRLSATMNLLTRKDTIIVASVSCIYNIGSPKEYGQFILELRPGVRISRDSIFKRLVALQYGRQPHDFKRGSFRVRGEVIDIFPAYEDFAIRLFHTGENVLRIVAIDPINAKELESLEHYTIYPAKHYMTDPAAYTRVERQIREDLEKQIRILRANGKEFEAHRLDKRVRFDLEMIAETGYVNGIENYSRYFDGRKPGDPPYTLLDYYRQPYKNDWLLFIDESHMTIPQIRGMYNGDKSRKQTLVDFGFRLPAALDNRPLTFSEFMHRIPQTIFVSATPSDWEISLTKVHSGVVEQLVRPTGIVDPEIEIRPTYGQVSDLAREILMRKARKERVLVTTLTKRMAEDLTEYLNAQKYLSDSKISKITSDVPKVQYLHSDIQTLERSDILDDLRHGSYDVLVGINLLREGLDLPEVSLVAILDADKEGFLRSQTSLIQTMGRAARHIRGKVIMYADSQTGSMKRAIEEITRRRMYQLRYNRLHGITPQSIDKPIREKLALEKDRSITKVDENLDTRKRIEYRDLLARVDDSQLTPYDRTRFIKKLEKEMKEAAKDLNFELAAEIRDKIRTLL